MSKAIQRYLRRRDRKRRKMIMLGVASGIACAALVFVIVWAVFLRDGSKIKTESSSAAESSSVIDSSPVSDTESRDTSDDENVSSEVSDKGLTGRWSIDDITIYQFDEGGKGKMCLPSDEYAFEYSVNGNKISIDFEDPDAIDRTYTMDLNGDELTLTRSETVVYKLIRIE